MWIVFRVDLIRKFRMYYFSRTARKTILRGFIPIKSDKVETEFFLKGNWNTTIFLTEPWKYWKSLVFWHSQGIKKKKHLPDIDQFAIYISLFLFDPWRHQEIKSAQLWRKSKAQLQGTGKRQRHGKEGNSARIYIHSRNLKIHKNFQYLKLSHIKYCSVLLKHKRSKTGT